MTADAPRADAAEGVARPGPLAIADRPAWDAISAFLQSDLAAYAFPSDAVYALLRSLAMEGYYVTKYPGC